MNNDYVDKATGLLSAIGIHQLSGGVWAFTDVHTASRAYVHHSLQPVALAAYTAVNATFANGRFHDWSLVDMVDKVPCMDGAELTALAMICGASIPTLPSASERGDIFGQAVWDIVEVYSLEGCFEYIERPYGSPGRHYNFAASRLRLGWRRRAHPRRIESNAEKLSRNVAAATDHGFNDHALVLPGQR